MNSLFSRCRRSTAAQDHPTSLGGRYVSWRPTRPNLHVGKATAGRCSHPAKRQTPVRQIRGSPQTEQRRQPATATQSVRYDQISVHIAFPRMLCRKKQVYVNTIFHSLLKPTCYRFFARTLIVAARRKISQANLLRYADHAYLEFSPSCHIRAHSRKVRRKAHRGKR